MPRRARVLLPGVPLHLIQRGNNHSACFFAEEDYLFYLEHLADQARKHDCAIHAWCLMTNHVHLLLTPAKPESAGMLMKGLGQRYVQYVNRRVIGVIGDRVIGDRPRWVIGDRPRLILVLLDSPGQSRGLSPNISTADCRYR
jgi:REP element-mobilizing transposase RayT